MQSLWAELGVDLRLRLWSDASAARACMAKRGLGRNKHWDLRALWLQELVYRGRVEVHSVPTEKNISDINTKALPVDRHRKLAKSIGMQYHDEDTQNLNMIAAISGESDEDDFFAFGVFLGIAGTVAVLGVSRCLRVLASRYLGQRRSA